MRFKAPILGVLTWGILKTSNNNSSGQEDSNTSGQEDSNTSGQEDKQQEKQTTKTTTTKTLILVFEQR
jgi:hypothetical protein